jgi:hypothetical protein
VSFSRWERRFASALAYATFGERSLRSPGGGSEAMADIFVSYTSNDRDWAFWIGQELEKLGHVARVHEWEISGGGDIAKWMDERLTNADQRRGASSRTRA